MIPTEQKIILLIIAIGIVSGSAVIFISLNDDTLQEGEDYNTYNGTEWVLTHEHVTDDELLLDLGTRTLDGNMHIYLEENIEDKEVIVESITRDSDDNIIIDANLIEKEDSNTTTQYIETNLEQVDLEDVYVNYHTDDSTTQLSREACGCVLEVDPVPENN